MENSNEYTFITKFIINDEPYYCKFNCTPNENDLFTIDIVNQSQSWYGTYSREEAKAFCDDLETEEEYFKNVMAALKNKEQAYIFDFTLDKDDTNVSKFVWKRKISKGSVIRGCVMLRNNVTLITKDNLIDYLMTKNETLQCTVELCHKKIDSLNNELLKYKREFENLIDIKSTIEDSLYGKFVQVLNSKKKRIRLLEDELNSVGENEQNTSHSYLDNDV